MAAAATVAAPSAPPRALDRRGIGFLVGAHAFNDMNQSVVPAVLPFLISQRHLSYAAAASLVLSLTIASSVVQPLFGYITDKRSIPWLIPAALVCGMSGTVLLGIAPTYPLLLLATLVAGFGSAAFHPEAGGRSCAPEFDAARHRGSQIARRDAVRVAMAIVGTECRAQQSVELRLRDHRAHFVDRKHAARDPERILQLNTRAVLPPDFGIGDQQQIADLLESRISADLFMESL